MLASGEQGEGMTKKEVEKLARDAMNIPGTRENADEVREDELDQGDNPEMNYCPSCGAKLSH